MTTQSSAGLYQQVLGFCLIHWRRRAWLNAGCALSLAIATISDAFVPLFAGDLIDAVSTGRRMAALYSVATIVGLAGFVLLWRFIGLYFLTYSSTSAMKQIVSEAFQRVQRLSTDWHGSTFAGATVRQITRGMWAYDVLSDTFLLGFLPSLLILVVTPCLLAWRWGLLGGIVALGVVLYVLVASMLVLRYVTPVARTSNAMDSRLGALLADSITCNHVVKTFAAEEREDEHLRDLAERWRSLTIKTWMRGTQAFAAQSIVLLALQATVLSLAVWFWVKGLASAGDVAFVLTSYTLIHGYLRETANHIRNLQRGVNDMEDLARLMALPIGLADHAGAGTLLVKGGEIVLDRVTFRYASRANTLYQDFSLTIRPGEKVGLVGPSGSGKSTFVKLIQRLYDIESGSIRLDGQNIAAVTQESLRSAISVVPQDPILFHRSLAENISYSRPDATFEEVIAAAKKAHAHEFISVLPEGYETLVGERGVKLSGGERQRIALARAVLADAPILIFDEATSSLDSVSEALLQKAVEEAIAGRTTIIVAHRLSTVQNVDRILVFDAGRVVEQGTHAELVQREGGHYRRLFQTQVLGMGGAAVELVAKSAAA